MDTEQAATLSRTLPDVLLALIKRMPAPEQSALLSNFKERFPEDYQAWYNQEVKTYLSLVKK